MFSKVEGAKFCFIVEHVEVFIKDIVMNELNSDFLFAVGKRTIVPVFALGNVVWVVRTKFCLVRLYLVQLLHP